MYVTYTRMYPVHVYILYMYISCTRVYIYLFYVHVYICTYVGEYIYVCATKQYILQNKAIVCVWLYETMAFNDIQYPCVERHVILSISLVEYLSHGPIVH